MNHTNWKSVGLVSLACMVGGATNLQAWQQESGGANSSDKARAKPQELSKKAGSAILWENNYESALEKSKATGKPIFWYVPTVPGTFMDRKEEVNRYMLAGPFSWPSIIKLINQNCIPLKVAPKTALAKQFNIRVYDFIEPGFLLVQPNEEVQLLANRMTTLHPRWTFKVLAKAMKDPSSWEDYSGNTTSLELETWRRVSASDWQLEPKVMTELLKGNSMESKLLAGMAAFRMGRHDEAKSIWQESSLAHPDHPLAWKASCEAQGIGPFCRGFEVFEALPESAVDGIDLKNVTSAALVNTFNELELWQRSVDYLLGMQNTNGGIFDSDYDFGGADSLPNVHTAVTSLVGLALMEAERRSTDPVRKKRIREALDRIVFFVSDDANLNFVDRDEILWGQAYRIRLLSACHRQNANAKVSEALQKAVKQLETLQLKTGGWYHEYANAFVSATALTALFDASQAGVLVDTNKVNSGLKRLASQRLSNGAYPYATRTENGKDAGTEKDLAASAGRISICELARKRWGQVDEIEFAKAVSKSMDLHDVLAIALKYDNHTSTFAYGGFFFWYDMQARSEAISLIADQEIKSKLAAKQRQLIISLPELDGCFVDSHELGRCYGTAMGLLSLGVLE